MNQVQIRDAKDSDVDSIVFLWNELAKFHVALNSDFQLHPDAKNKFNDFLTSKIRAPEEFVIKVAEMDKKIVGYMMGGIKLNSPVFILKKYGEISDAYISADYRRQGIGEQLLHEMKLWYKGKEITRIDINAAATNQISNNFWEKVGFLPFVNHKRLQLE